MAEKFVVKKGQTGKFRFSLLGRNGPVIATSEAYNSKAACMNGIKAVQAVTGRAGVEDQTTRAWADEQTRLKNATKVAAGAANSYQGGGEDGAGQNRGEDHQSEPRGATTAAVRTAKAAPKTAKAAASGRRKPAG